MDGQGERGKNDIAEQIRRALSQALDFSDFDQLNRSISGTVDSALDEARQQFERYRSQAAKQSGQPVDTQAANWVPEEADSAENSGAGSASGAGARGGSGTSAGSTGGSFGGGEYWRHGTRQPGDDGRYRYETGAAMGGAAGTGAAGDISGAGQYVSGGAYADHSSWKSTYSSEPYTYGGQKQMPQTADYRVRWRGRISGILMSMVGALGTSVFGMFTFLMLTMSIIVIDGSAGWLITLLLALITGGFGLLLWGGVSRYGRNHRLKLYLDEIKKVGRPYCEVGRLGRAAGRGENFAKKDLKKILELGMLPDARMDDKGTYLMMDAETYHQYQMSQESLRARQEQERLAKQREEEMAREAKRAEKARKARKDGDVQNTRDAQAKAAPGAGSGTNDAVQNDSGDAAVNAAIARGEEQMETLDQLRQSLPAGEMTDKLIRLDRVLERLFATLRKYPDQLDELERFMEYYLPTTVKLVTAYSEFASVEFPGDNINNAKKEIEETMDTINGAFEKLLDDMYEDTAFDVMTDASVLQTILKREGLTEGDFDGGSGQKTE